VPNVTAQTLKPIIVQNVNKASYLMTDESPVYWPIGSGFAGHGTVNHSAEEYVRAAFWHTNTVENYFSILKRAVFGCYFHVSEAHLHRYAAERDFVYNHRERLVTMMRRAPTAFLSARRVSGSPMRRLLAESRARRHSEVRQSRRRRKRETDSRQLELPLFDE
jgi:hypothetical protein